VLVLRLRSSLTSSLTALGVPPAKAAEQAAQLSQSQGNRSLAAIPHFVRLDFAHATQTVFLAMAAIMAAAALVAFLGLRAGRQRASDEAPAGSIEPGVAEPAATGG